MDRPVTIGNVHNMSLESLSDEHPHLVAQFSCETEVQNYIQFCTECCSAFWLHDMYNVTVKGIKLAFQISSMLTSGIMLNNVLVHTH